MGIHDIISATVFSVFLLTYIDENPDTIPFRYNYFGTCSPDPVIFCLIGRYSVWTTVTAGLPNDFWKSVMYTQDHY